MWIFHLEILAASTFPHYFSASLSLKVGILSFSTFSLLMQMLCKFQMKNQEFESKTIYLIVIQNFIIHHLFNQQIITTCRCFPFNYVKYKRIPRTYGKHIGNSILQKTDKKYRLSQKQRTWLKQWFWLSPTELRNGSEWIVILMFLLHKKSIHFR